MINNKKDANSIFAILPYEILNYIIIHLPLHDRIQCIQVSKAWRSLFLSSSGMWSDISECNNMACNLVRYKLNGKDIHKVNLTTGANKQDGIDFLLRSGCSNINFCIKNGIQ
ncbi:hypothetical protein BDA99DRAFT_338590 [Phascolomyces articulosus]|uniref:F-box domain-containing protein n=1 Tax=Phascolomyces articulosus TaxID=60185 RepID=A0AAD5PFT7_9FUNG|nr:hypothetical protein BDA99DRAFT_338590 [Phascolomyces articulosus]